MGRTRSLKSNLTILNRSSSTVGNFSIIFVKNSHLSVLRKTWHYWRTEEIEEGVTPRSSLNAQVFKVALSLIQAHLAVT